MKTKNLLKKAFLLLALVGGTSSAWADNVYEYTNTPALNTSNYFTPAKDGGSASTYNVSITFDLHSGTSTTVTKAIKMESKTTISFTNTRTADVYIGIFLRYAKNDSKPGYNSVKFDGSAHATTTATAASSYEIITISDVAAGEHVIAQNGAETEVYYVKVVEKSSTSAPTITTQPVSATYLVDETPAALTVEAEASAGGLSYQWYSNTTGTADPENDTDIDGATYATLAAAKISTASTGTTYYYVVVTDGNGSTTSDLATITVVTGIAPDVSAAISASAVRAGTTVTLTATVNAGTPAPTLQWYTCDSDGSNESPIDGATNTTYQPSTASTGTYYFKVKAHNDSGDDYSDVVTLTVIAQGVSGAVGDLETISSNYTFIADNHTGNGVVGFTSDYLYDGNRIFSPLGNIVATNKGTSTIDGNTYYNSLRVKNNTQDVLAFKVGGACAITFYTENPGKSRTIKVGNAVNNDSYGTISDANEDHIVYIPSATTVYLTGSGDRFIAGYKVTFTVPVAVTSAGFATYVPSYDLDFTSTGIKAYTAKVNTSTGIVALTQINKVPANTPVLLYKAGGDTENIPVAASTDAVGDNDLHVGTGAAV